MQKLSRYLTIWIMMLLPALCAQSRAAAPAFEAGDRVCFLGDSIFHGGKIHSNLLLFYATRYPDRPMMFHNAGVAGDTAKEALRRLEWDVAPFRPNVTVIMFGMNDVGRWLYGEGKDTPGNIEQRQRMLDSYRESTARMLQETKGTKVILCTPTPFDQTTTRESANARGVDDALALVAENVRRVARENLYGLVDFHAEMNRVIREQQAKDPKFTMMDGIRVHPDDAGHMLMTCIFLKAQGMTPSVAHTAVDASSGLLANADNCEISALQANRSGVSFSYLAKSLPFPVESKAAAALEWVPFTRDLNQETLVVLNLDPGEYTVYIDGEAVGTWPASEFAKGINLADNPNTPQYKQAAAIAELNEKRRSRENSTLRVFAALEHDVLRPKGVDPSDMAAVRKVMDAAIEEEGRNKTWRHSYFINLSKAYYAEKPRQQQTEKELADMTAKMFEMARPKAHQIEVKAAQQ